MTNKHKGEFTFTAAGSDWKGVLDFNTFAELEEKLGIGFIQLHKRFNDETQLRLTDVRTLFYCALKQFHPEVTERIVGHLLQELTIPGAMKLLQEAVGASFGSEAGGEEGGQAGTGENPSKPATGQDAGTGPA